MSLWSERILQAFTPDLSRLWIAADPDDVLRDEQILSGLRRKGFELVPFEDSVAFRADYEERWRAAWDRGEDGPAAALVLHLRGGAVGELPWDYLRDSRKVSLSLADLFPKLSYPVVRQIGPEHLAALFDVHESEATRALGEAETKDFILLNIFEIVPRLLTKPEKLWPELLRLHFADRVLPPVLAERVAEVLEGRGGFPHLWLDRLFSSKGYFLRVVQEAWEQHLAVNGVHVRHRNPGVAEPAAAIPFEHPDVKVLADAMFLDGVLLPVSVEGTPSGLPDWAKAGVAQHDVAQPNRVADAAERLARTIPDSRAPYREWAHFSLRLGEIIRRFHSLAPAQAETIADRVRALQMAADARLLDWVREHFADLPSLPVAKGPVMVHHVPRFLSLRREAGETRVALLVFDGLAMDQWVQIRERLAAQAPGIEVEEGACFAWAPTLTSVSRQALFSGLKPREFAGSIGTTAQEPALWSRFWLDHGLRAQEVLYRKGIRRTDQLAELASALVDPSIKAAGVVVDMVDEIVHGAVMGKRGVSGQIGDWCETGFVERLLGLLLDQGFHLYLTADHGNVDAIGIGRLNQGVASELRGERVRIYRSEALAAATPGDIDAFRLDVAGLPADFLPLFAGGRGAFVQKGEPVVAHGGLSVEELIVPFVKASRSSP